MSWLANMNCNDTLVMQMIMRDLEHGTSHHRYGYSEELEYSKYLGKNQFTGDDPTFDQIADEIYAAAIAYDSLVKNFYPGYQNRSDVFFFKIAFQFFGYGSIRTSIHYKNHDIYPLFLI